MCETEEEKGSDVEVGRGKSFEVGGAPKRSKPRTDYLRPRPPELPSLGLSDGASELSSPSRYEAAISLSPKYIY